MKHPRTARGYKKNGNLEIWIFGKLVWTSLSGEDREHERDAQKEARKPRGKPHFPALRLGYTSSCHDLVPHPARPMSALPVCRRPRSICGPSGCPVHEIDGHVGKREVAAKSTKCQRVYTPGA